MTKTLGYTIAAAVIATVLFVIVYQVTTGKSFGELISLSGVNAGGDSAAPAADAPKTAVND